MRLLAQIEARLGAEASPFRAQLLREDLQRLRRLQVLAAATPERDGYLAAGRRLGWTQGDQRTDELRGVLDALLDAVFEHERGRRGDEQERRIQEAWAELTAARIEKLVGCLSTPVPRPEE